MFYAGKFQLSVALKKQVDLRYTRPKKKMGGGGGGGGVGVHNEITFQQNDFL